MTLVRTFRSPPKPQIPPHAVRSMRRQVQEHLSRRISGSKRPRTFSTVGRSILHLQRECTNARGAARTLHRAVQYPEQQGLVWRVWKTRALATFCHPMVLPQTFVCRWRAAGHTTPQGRPFNHPCTERSNVVPSLLRSPCQLRLATHLLQSGHLTPLATRSTRQETWQT